MEAHDLPESTSITDPVGSKYIRKESDGSVTWESGANRTATVPSSGNVTLNDIWRN
ncbi:carbohydrate-binding module family 20 domain-containing protein [Peterkaempfera sp. SMS 1(5)a]